MPNVGSEISSQNPLLEYRKEVPIVEGFTDEFLLESGFTSADELLDGRLSNLKYGAGLIQVAFVFGDLSAYDKPIKLCLYGRDNSLQEWTCVHKDLKLYEGYSYPVNPNLNTEQKALDIPIRFLHWGWYLDPVNYPNDAPDTRILIYSSINRVAKSVSKLLPDD